MGDPRLMREAALYLLGALMPEGIDHRESGDYIADVSPGVYERFSIEKRATYDLARELWNGCGAVSRFILSADGRRARVGITAITVACGPITLDMA